MASIDLQSITLLWNFNFKCHIFISMISKIAEDCQVSQCLCMPLTWEPTYELDLGFTRSNFEITIHQEWIVRLIWNENHRKMYQALTSPMTLIFSRSNFKIAASEECLDQFIWNEKYLNQYYFAGLAQERHNSSALAMELCLSCVNPSIWWWTHYMILTFDLTLDLDHWFSWSTE